MKKLALGVRVVFVLLFAASFCLSSEIKNRFGPVDNLSRTIYATIPENEIVVLIDHARLAEKQGVMMPASQVIIFANPVVNTPLLEINPVIGLDLPCRMLVYSEAMDGEGVKVIYASANFIRKRHGLDASVDLDAYTAAIKAPLKNVVPGLVEEVGGDGVVSGFGIRYLASPFGFNETIQRLKKGVMAEGNRTWFTIVNYEEEARVLGVTLPQMRLLLFGSPAPGGGVMANFPKLGLDAFCQKVLVYKDGEGVVQVIYNDIVRLAELHYGASIKPHQVVEGWVGETIQQALGGQEQ